MKKANNTTGTIKYINGRSGISESDYILLPLTFKNYKEKGAMFVEFWQETGKSYLTGIGSGACPPVNSKFVFSKSIAR